MPGKFQGISRRQGSQERWKAFLRLDGRLVHLGYHDSEAAAALRVDEARAEAGLPPVNFSPTGEELRMDQQSGREGVTWEGGLWRAAGGGLYPSISAACKALRRVKPRRALNGSLLKRPVPPERLAQLKANMHEYNAWADAKRAELSQQEPWASMDPAQRRNALWPTLKELWRARGAEGGAGAAAAAAGGGGGAGEGGEAPAPAQRRAGAGAARIAHAAWAREKKKELAMQLPWRDMYRVERDKALAVKLKELWAEEKGHGGLGPQGALPLPEEL
jgi:hypothetical protein